MSAVEVEGERGVPIARRLWRAQTQIKASIPSWLLQADSEPLLRPSCRSSAREWRSHPGSGQQRRRLVFGERRRRRGRSEASVDFFPSLCVDPLSLFLRRSSSTGPVWYRFRVPTRELARRRLPSARRPESKRRGPGRESQVDERATIAAAAADLSLHLRSCSCSQLPRGAPLELSLSRDKDRSRQRARRPRSSGRKRSHGAGEAKLEKVQRRRPTCDRPPRAAAGCSQSERESEASERAAALFPFSFLYVPAASLAALGPVDRVPGVLHHGEIRRKERKERCFKTRSCEKEKEREPPPPFFFLLFSRAASRLPLTQKNSASVRPTTLSLLLLLPPLSFPL